MIVEVGKGLHGWVKEGDYSKRRARFRFLMLRQSGRHDAVRVPGIPRLHVDRRSFRTGSAEHQHASSAFHLSKEELGELLEGTTKKNAGARCRRRRHRRAECTCPVFVPMRRADLWREGWTIE